MVVPGPRITFAFYMSETILYIDTSGQYSLLMLMNRQTILTKRSTHAENQHAQSINTHIAELLNEVNLSWQQLSGVAVLNGPGSYTGLRIGLATAKGICYALNIPLILINHLQLMHAAYAVPGKVNAYLLKARQDEYFLFVPDGLAEQTSSPALVSASVLHTRILNEHLSLLTVDKTLSIDFPEIQEITILETDILDYVFCQFQAKKFADLLHAEPFYLKSVHINKINKL